MAVGADGLLRADGERLKPREVDSIFRTITDGEVGATGDQFRKTRSRILKGEKELASEYIDVTTTVSAASTIVIAASLSRVSFIISSRSFCKLEKKIF